MSSEVSLATALMHGILSAVCDRLHVSAGAAHGVARRNGEAATDQRQNHHIPKHVSLPNWPPPRKREPPDSFMNIKTPPKRIPAGPDHLKCES